jgi:hypothetical protein
MKRLLIAAVVVVACVLAVLLLRLFSATKGEVDIRNDANETVVAGEISVCGQRFDFESTEPK